MREIVPFRYEVRQNETITIEVDPQDGAGEEQTALAVDGNEVTSSGGPRPTYVFSDTSTNGSDHFGILECSFAGAPDGAKFVVTLRGSVEGQAGFVVTKAQANHAPNLEFRVR